MEDQIIQLKQKTVEEWVHAYGNDLFTWAYHKTSNRAVAEDLVQETFLATYKSFDSFKGKSEPRTWIFRILNNKIIDHYRKSARDISNGTAEAEENGYKATEALFDEYSNWKKNGLEGAWEDEKHLLDNPEFNQVMDICMDDLSPTWKTAILWKFHLNKEATEICQELKITPSNYWQILHRAKLLLKKCLEVNWFSRV
jgi:RNA polymerase sigma-70 factor (TIGR02943 family)